jgi:hypothetical protein
MVFSRVLQHSFLFIIPVNIISSLVVGSRRTLTGIVCNNLMISKYLIFFNKKNNNEQINYSAIYSVIRPLIPLGWYRTIVFVHNLIWRNIKDMAWRMKSERKAKRGEESRREPPDTTSRLQAVANLVSLPSFFIFLYSFVIVNEKK